MYSKLIQWSLMSLLCALSLAEMPGQWDHELRYHNPIPSNACVSGVHIVASPGDHHCCTHYSRIGTLVNNITSLIPHSNSYLTGPYGHKSFIAQTKKVGRQLRDHVEFYHNKCPHTKIVLVGYSNGAVVTMNALCGASPVPPWTPSRGLVKRYPIVAAVVYGEETYAAHKPFNVGSCKSNAPNGHRTDLSGCKGFFNNIQNYCIAPDSECCGTGHNYSAHFIYQQFDVQAARFVRSRFLASQSEEA